MCNFRVFVRNTNKSYGKRNGSGIRISHYNLLGQNVKSLYTLNNHTHTSCLNSVNWNDRPTIDQLQPKIQLEPGRGEGTMLVQTPREVPLGQDILGRPVRHGKSGLRLRLSPVINVLYGPWQNSRSQDNENIYGNKWSRSCGRSTFKECMMNPYRSKGLRQIPWSLSPWNLNVTHHLYSKTLIQFLVLRRPTWRY